MRFSLRSIFLPLSVLALMLSIFFLVFWMIQTTFLGRVAYMLNDSLTYALQYPHNRHADEVVIVKIDDKTLDSLTASDLGIFTLDKGVYAQALEKLFEQYRAAVVGVDIVFANPSALGEEDEQRLADSLEKYHQRVVIATHSSGNPSPLCIYAPYRQAAIDLPQSERIRSFSLRMPYKLDADLCGQNLSDSQSAEYIDIL